MATVFLPRGPGRGAVLLLCAVVHMGLLFGLVAHVFRGEPTASPPIFVPLQFFPAQLPQAPQAARPKQSPPDAAAHRAHAAPPAPPIRSPLAPASSPAVSVIVNTAPVMVVQDAAPAEASAGIAAKPALAPLPVPVPPAALQSAHPDYAYNPPPAYPQALREQGLAGTVWLRVWVETDGSPGQIHLLKGSGLRLFDEAALRAVKLWRFIPARRGDQLLASWVEIPVRFVLS